MVELCWIHVWDLKLTNLSGYIDTQIQNDPNRPNQLVSSRMKQSRGRSQRSWAVVEFGRPWHVTSQFVGMVDSTMISIWLVVWNYFLIFSIYWECHHPNWRKLLKQWSQATYLGWFIRGHRRQEMLLKQELLGVWVSGAGLSGTLRMKSVKDDKSIESKAEWK